MQNFKLEIQTTATSYDIIHLNDSDITLVNAKNYCIFNEEYQQTEHTLQQIRTSHMNSEEEYEILKLIKKHQNTFYHPESNLTFTYAKSYRYPFIHKEEVQKQI